MPRTKYKGLNIITPVSMDKVTLERILEDMPQSINVSEISAENTFELEDIEDQRNHFEDKVEFEVLLINILMLLEDREKVIFLYQILRDDGYQIDHNSCAQSLNIKLRQYMDLLNKVKTKVAIFISCSPSYNPGLKPPKQEE